MNSQGEERRQSAKTREQYFRQKLEIEFEFAPRIAQAVLEEAQACLSGQGEAMAAGQMVVYLARREAGHGKPLGETALVAVRWTVDGGSEDRAVLARHGREALRRVRIQRLVDEAVEQGALATQEDLARVLQVTVRTIKRDCKQLHAEGTVVALRGAVRGIGRGQSHKGQIIRRWLAGESYDQLERSTKHSVVSIRRYIQHFVRVVELQQAGFAEAEVAHLTQQGLALVQEYLTIYQQIEAPASQRRLAEQMARFQRADVHGQTAKGGAR
jgi:DNA-binding transcriptional regulator YhcF (GntR family)